MGRDALSALAEKYDTLVALRRERLAGTPLPPRATFQALARRHPGCLRELDRLPLEDLEARARACRLAAAGAPSAPWMAWVHGYHAILRCAMRVRDELGAANAAERRVRLSELDLVSLAATLSASEGVEVDAELLARLCDPPGGRVVELVLGELTRRAGVEARALRATFDGALARAPA